MRLIFLLFILQCTFCPFTLAQTYSVELESLLQAHHRDHSFEGVVLVAQNGKPKLEWACGLADHETSAQFTLETRFPIGSITKHLTAILILQMIENEQLSMSSTVGELLPHLSIPGAPKITVRHLLTNTSGLPDEDEKLYKKRNSPRIIVERSVAKIKDYDPLGRYDKNNMDYLLLGMIIEQEMGQTWQNAMNEKIIETFGLKNTGFLMWSDTLAATGYQLNDSNRVEKVEAFNIENYFSAGAMYSTAGDLLKIDVALQNNELLSEKGMNKLYSRENGRGKWKYGCSVYTYPFIFMQPVVIESNSTLGGFRISWIRIPQYDFTMIIMSNQPNFEVDTFGDLANLKEQLLLKTAPCGNEHFERCGW